MDLDSITLEENRIVIQLAIAGCWLYEVGHTCCCNHFGPQCTVHSSSSRYNLHILFMDMCPIHFRNVIQITTAISRELPFSYLTPTFWGKKACLCQAQIYDGWSPKAWTGIKPAPLFNTNDEHIQHLQRISSQILKDWKLTPSKYEHKFLKYHIFSYILHTQQNKLELHISASADIIHGQSQRNMWHVHYSLSVVHKQDQNSLRSGVEACCCRRWYTGVAQTVQRSRTARGPL
jgi:hypothetical protein